MKENSISKKQLILNWKSVRFMIFLFKEYGHNKCSESAAFLTYTTLLSFVPIFAILVMVLSSIPILEPARAQVFDAIYSGAIPDDSGKVAQYLTEFIEKSASVGSVGAGALIYTSMAMLLKIERTFTSIWERDIIKSEKKKLTFKEKVRVYVVTFLRFLAIIIFVPIILGIAFTFSGTLKGLSHLDFGAIGSMIGTDINISLDLSFLNTTIGLFGIEIMSLLITSAGFGLMYWFIPRAKVPRKHALFAGFVTAILFVVLKSAFGFMMAKFTSYSSVYGAFAALPSFMLWLNLSWGLILLGVQVSYCSANYHKCNLPIKNSTPLST